MSLKKAAIINAIGKYSIIFFSIVITAILSRILSPEEYGVIAVVTVFSTFFSFLANNGFSTAIVQKHELTSNDINNIYSFSVYLSFFLMMAFAACAWPISLFYKDNKYIPVCLLLCIALFFDSLNMVPNGILTRDKRFVLLTIRTIVVYLISSAITIYLALKGGSYYSLVFNTIFTSVMTFLCNRLSCNLRFKIRFEFESIKKIFNYSGFQFAFNMINYFSRNLDNLLSGKFLGIEQLGFYNKAYTIMLYPVNNLAGVISSVLHPFLADYKEILDKIYEKYIIIAKLFMDCGIYISVICFFCSNEIILILFGSQWSETIQCFKLLSIAIMPQMVNSSIGSVFQSIGNTKLLFVNGLVNTVISILLITVSIFFGKNIYWLSFAVMFAYLVHWLLAQIMLVKCGFKYSLKKYIASFYKELIIIMMMILSVVFCPDISVDNIYYLAILKGLYISLIFLISLIITREYKFLLLIIKKR